MTTPMTARPRSISRSAMRARLMASFLRLAGDDDLTSGQELIQGPDHRLCIWHLQQLVPYCGPVIQQWKVRGLGAVLRNRFRDADRKSTRLNSSHVRISY